MLVWRLSPLGSPECGERSTKMTKILIAFDGGEAAHRALELAAELAQKFEASVGVVSVVPVHSGRVAVDPWDDRSVHATELAEAAKLLRQKGIEPVMYEPAGDPAPTIEKIAEEGGYDMVVVGSRGLGLLSRALQGSVSEHVATHSKTTVVVAR
jgi:nucleotide-binding universal stress UspA family protein